MHISRKFILKLAAEEPESLPSWMRYPRLSAVPGDSATEALSEEVASTGADADAVSPPAVNTNAPSAPTSTGNSEPTALPTLEDYKLVTDFATLMRQEPERRNTLRNITSSSSATPAIAPAQTEAGPSNAPESPRKSMLKRKRSQGEVGREDMPKRLKVSKPKTLVQENATSAPAVKSRKATGKRGNGKEKDRKVNVTSDGSSEVAATSTAVVAYRVAQAGTAVKKGCIRIPPKATAERR